MIETNFSNVEIAEILDTNLFDMENVLTSAGWFVEIEKDQNGKQIFKCSTWYPDKPMSEKKMLSCA